MKQCRIGQKASRTTSAIALNAVATALESGGDGTSVEEKLEALDNVGDVQVSRSAVNKADGGYSWTVTFLRDDPQHCEQRDTASNLCNAPGDVPRLRPVKGTTLLHTVHLAGVRRPLHDLVRAPPVASCTRRSTSVLMPPVARTTPLWLKHPLSRRLHIALLLRSRRARAAAVRAVPRPW